MFLSASAGFVLIFERQMSSTFTLELDDLWVLVVKDASDKIRLSCELDLVMSLLTE